MPTKITCQEASKYIQDKSSLVNPENDQSANFYNQIIDRLTEAGENYNVYVQHIDVSNISADQIRQIIGKNGCYFIETTRRTDIDFIWHNRETNTFEFIGPKHLLKKAITAIKKRIQKFSSSQSNFEFLNAIQKLNLHKITELLPNNDPNCDNGYSGNTLHSIIFYANKFTTNPNCTLENVSAIATLLFEHGLNISATKEIKLKDDTTTNMTYLEYLDYRKKFMNLNIYTELKRIITEHAEPDTKPYTKLDTKSTTDLTTSTDPELNPAVSIES
mgnify:CR=1 FL=1